jgi:flagellar hook-length control protein FliK
MTTTVSANAAVSASASSQTPAALSNAKNQPVGQDFMSLVEALNANEATPPGNTGSSAGPTNTVPDGTNAPIAKTPVASTGQTDVSSNTVSETETALAPATDQTTPTSQATGKAAIVSAATAPALPTLPASQANLIPAGAGVPASSVLASTQSTQPTISAPPAGQPVVVPAKTVATGSSAPVPSLDNSVEASPTLAATDTVSGATTSVPAETGLAVSIIPTGEKIAASQDANSSAAVADTATGNGSVASDNNAALVSAKSAPTGFTDSSTKGLNAGAIVLSVGTGQKSAAGKATDKTSPTPDAPNSPPDNNALAQVAALTVTSTPLVVPQAAVVAATAQPLGLQFSVFTNKPAATANATTSSTADDDESEAENTSASSFSVASDAADPQASVPPLPPVNTQSDALGQGKFSNEIAQVLSLTQAGISRPDKADKASAADDISSPSASSDNALSSAGLTLTRQETGQVFTNTLASVSGSQAASLGLSQTPVDQVSVVMQRAAADQMSSMTIALNPAELGRVEVSLKFGKDGSVQANVMADNAGTLTMLKNDQTALHQALENAGLNPDSNSLSFSLRDDQAQQGQQQNFDGSNSQNTPANGTQNNAEADSLASSVITYAVQNTDNSHVNLFV